MSETEQEVPVVTLTKPIYLTRVTVAGNRLSDLIDALRQMDPDTWISVCFVEREGPRIRLDGVETPDPDGDIIDRGWVPDSEALL